MADYLIRKCTLMDLLLFIFGLLVLFAAGINAIWVFFVICGFILAKAYIRSTEILEKSVSPVQTGRGLGEAESDWDDDDNLAIGLYD